MSGEAMSARVSTERVRALAGSHPGDHSLTVVALAADLLDAREEIERLKAAVICRVPKTAYMEAEASLTTARALLREAVFCVIEAQIATDSDDTADLLERMAAHLEDSPDA